MRAFALHFNTTGWREAPLRVFAWPTHRSLVCQCQKWERLLVFPCELSVRLAHKLEWADKRLGGRARRALISVVPLSPFAREQERQAGDKGWPVNGVEKKGR